MKRAILAIYRLLLLLLPPTFRRDWGEAMVEEAGTVLCEARRPGGRGAASAGAHLVMDGSRTLLREWGSVLRPGGDGLLPSLAREGSMAIRSFVRAPLFTVTVVATLALGIGATTAIFSVVDAVLLRPLPFHEPQELVSVWPGTFQSRAALDRFRSELRTLEDVSGYTGTLLTLSEGEPTELFGSVVSPSHFRVMGTAPELGRGFVEDEGVPGGAAVAVLSHRLWMERFGGDPAVVGRDVALQDDEEARRTVIGVMPPGYRALQGDVDVWIPLITDPTSDRYLDSSSLELVARLRDGSDVEAASRELQSLARRMEEEDPRRNTREEVEIASVVSLARELAGGLRQRLLALFGAVGVVLLIACVNVANLFLVRTASRERELGLRTALGAGRARLARQLLVESSLLALGGGTVGLALAVLFRNVLVSAAARGSARAAEAGLDTRVLLFTVALSLGVGLLFGVGPALRAGSQRPAGALGSGRGAGSDRHAHRVHHALVAGEVALALVAVFAGALLAGSVRRVSRVDPGFETEGVLTFRLTAPPADFPDDGAVLAYYRQIIDGLRKLPGVENAGAVSRLPMGGGTSRISLNPDWYQIPEGEAAPLANHRLITEGYAETVGLRLREGRFFSPEDRDGPKPALVNATLADRWWPDGALGHYIRGPDGPWVYVVGVIEDVREDGLDQPPFAAVYLPHRDWVWRTMTLVVASRLPMAELLPAVKEVVWSVSPGVPVARTRTLGEVVERSVRDLRTTADLFTLFALLALTLGAVGVYGVVAYTTGQRRREFGIRGALGATRASIRVGMLRRAAMPLAAGLMAGSAATGVVGRLLDTILLSRDPVQLPTLGGVLALVAAVGLAATWLPVRKATAVDPADALRQE